MAVRTKASTPAKRGAKPRHETLGLTLDDVKGMYRVMLQCRMLGERMMQLNRMGRAAFVGVADGHEGAEVGSAWCIQRGVDWCHPYYRDVGVALVLGQTAKDQFLGVFAKATDPNSAGRQIVNQFSDVEAKIVTGSVNIATQFPQAAGIALALKMRKERAVVFTYGGDGSTSPGDFHEALNFAAIHDLPVVFIIENNLYGEFTPVRDSTPIDDLADRAAGYGIPGRIVDGQDVGAMYSETLTAIERARAGDGPTLIEAKTYRFRGHSKSDPAKYRPEGELERWKERDPISLLGGKLAAAGHLSAEDQQAIWAETQIEVDRAAEHAASAPYPTLEEIEDYVYAS